MAREEVNHRIQEKEKRKVRACVSGVTWSPEGPRDSSATSANK
jgi:hypothetical protein